MFDFSMFEQLFFLHNVNHRHQRFVWFAFTLISGKLLKPISFMFHQMRMKIALSVSSRSKRCKIKTKRKRSRARWWVKGTKTFLISWCFQHFLFAMSKSLLKFCAPFRLNTTEKERDKRSCKNVVMKSRV